MSAAIAAGLLTETDMKVSEDVEVAALASRHTGLTLLGCFSPQTGAHGRDHVDVRWRQK
jgi:hypothetical protein